MSLRRLAQLLAVTAVALVAALGVAAALVDRHRPDTRATPAPQDAPARGWHVPDGWVRVAVAGVSYAVPPSWQRRPVGERTAYREDGAVIASGRGQAMSWGNRCRAGHTPVPGAWAVLADPVRSANVGGVAEATAAAWARGYAGLPDAAPLVASPARSVLLAGDREASVSRVRIDLGGSGNPCAGARAELSAVALAAGDEVVTLVAARYLGIPGAPGDAAYAGVLASLRRG